ncbi:VOC family protein [Salinicola avicenniae]|uniref:VOC family protein n=1 Tax=Salinicola avicenniae TaxID=2916836 RepID=UPI002073C831|nr:MULTISPECIES: VOC family protein [unclassified Salinicola]
MFSHIMIGARDFTGLTNFYDKVLSPLGLVRSEVPASASIWHYPGQRWPLFAIREPFNGLPATWGNGTQVSFSAASVETVDEVWKRAIEAGGADEGKPGLRPQYAEDYYGAYFRDPEGNKLCVVHVGGLPAQPT